MKPNSLPPKVYTQILGATAINNQTLEPEVNPFEGVNPDIELTFEPLHQWTSCGNSYERSKTVYKKVEILHTVSYSWNILKRPYDTFCLGLILPMDTVLVNGQMFNYYEPEGFGCPDFSTLKDALEFIDNNPEIVNNNEWVVN